MKRRNLNQKEQDQLQKAKQENKNLKREIKRLKSELKTYNKAFEKTADFLDNELDHLPVEEVVKAVQRGQRLKEIVQHQKEERKQLLTDKELRDKWQCYECGRGTMLIAPLSRRDGEFYFRVCSNTACDNRTRMKKYHDGVEGIKK